MTSHRTIPDGHAFPLSRWKIRSESAQGGRVDADGELALVDAAFIAERTLRAEVVARVARIGHDDLSSVEQTACLHF